MWCFINVLWWPSYYSSGLLCWDSLTKWSCRTQVAIFFKGSICPLLWYPNLLKVELLLLQVLQVNHIPSTVLGVKFHILCYFLLVLSTHYLLRSLVGTCFVHTPDSSWDKLVPRSIKCMHFCSSHTQKRFKCYSSSLHRHFVCAGITFKDSLPFFPVDPSHCMPTLVPSPPQSTLNVYLCRPKVSPGQFSGFYPHPFLMVYVLIHLILLLSMYSMITCPYHFVLSLLLLRS